MLNITKVRFNGRLANTPPLYQYDYGQKIVFCGLNLPTTYEVHFANEGDVDTITVLGDETGVLIPDEFLTTGKNVFAWIFLHEGLDDGETEYKVTIPVTPRAKPTDIEPTPVQQDIITQAISILQDETGKATESADRAEDAADRAEEAAASIDDEKIGEMVTDYLDEHPVTVTEEDPTVPSWAKQPNKPTYTAQEVGAVSISGLSDAIDTALAQAKASGEFDGKDGDDGYSPQASVSKSENTTTITIRDKSGTTTAQISDGESGDDGFSPTVSITEITNGHTVSITDADGTKSFNVMDGQDGQDGQNGATPVKGIDYFDGEDGYSPTASVSKSGNKTTISITDKSGTTTAQVNDGLQGEPGDDGFSPSASVNKSGSTSTVTITDKTGTTTAQIEDGQDGITPTVSVTSITGGHNVAFSYGSGDIRNTNFDILDGQDGATGANGSDGSDGITPTTTVTQITGGHNVAFSYGTGDSRNTDFDVMDGQDGYTPVKGVDYFDGAKGDKGDDGDAVEISILFIGNSLTQDGIAYLPYVLKTYYPKISFRFYMWYNGGYTLSSHYNKFINNEAPYTFSVAENDASWTNDYSATKTMAEILSEYTFDVVCLQEYFNSKTTYGASDLIDWENCKNYVTEHYTGGNALEFIALFPAPKRGRVDIHDVYDLTINAHKLILQNTIIDDIIGAGIAVFNATHTPLDSLGDQNHLSPDDVHTQEGLPCLLQTYVALLWIFNRLGYMKSVYGHPMRMTTDIYQSIKVPGPNLGTGVITGTDDENLLAQEVAILSSKETQEFVTQYKTCGAIDGFTKLDNFVHTGKMALTVSDFEVGGYVYFAKVINNTRIRSRILFPVKRGYKIKFTNPSFKIYIGVLETTRSYSYSYTSGWIAAGQVDEKYEIPIDGYCNILFESPSGLDVAITDFDCSVEILENDNIVVQTVSGTDVSITGVANTRYICGEVSTISITPPNSGIIDVVFSSGSTVAVLTLPQTVKMPYWFEVEANKTYEINIMDGIYGAVMSWT